MKTIYLDSEFRCHVADDGTMTAIETDFFDRKCDFFIEGYRVIPSGKSWTRDDGVVFDGEMVAPFKPYGQLLSAQIQYESDLAEADASYREGVNSV